MKDEILLHLENPEQLERLYRSDKSAFKRSFKLLYPDISGNAIAAFWNARLSFAREEVSWGTRTELWFVILASIVAGSIAKFPALFHIDEAFFYSRNIGFIVFPALIAYFAWKNNLSLGKIAFLVSAILAGLIFINALPGGAKSQTLDLSCIHLALCLWSLLGFAFVGERKNDVQRRLGYLRYNGDLIVISTLILIAGGMLTGVTIGLFSLIGLNIERFFFDYVVIFALPAAPIIGTWLTRANPQLVGKVSPVIAKIFSPLVLMMLLIYLAAIFYSGKDPYNDREFLIIFNALLVGVMAIIFFSVAGTSNNTKPLAEIWILLLLSAVTLVVNGIALSAIVFRISEWGITPNRAAVLGGNILFLGNLLLVTAQLWRVVLKKIEVAEVGKPISFYLPIYAGWAVVVTFLFPLIFKFN